MMIHGMSEWLTDELTVCDWLKDWLNEWRNDWMGNRLAEFLNNSLNERGKNIWITDWVSEWQADWLIKRSTDWLTKAIFDVSGSLMSSQRSRHITNTAEPHVNRLLHTQQKRKIQTWNPCKSDGAQHYCLACRFRSAKFYGCGELGHTQSVCYSPRAYVTDGSSSGSTHPTQFKHDKHLPHQQFCPPFLYHWHWSCRFIRFWFINPTCFAIFRIRNVDIFVKNITGHEPPVLGTCVLCLSNSNSNTYQRPFLVFDFLFSIISPNSMKFFDISLSFFTDLPFQTPEVNWWLF